MARTALKLLFLSLVAGLILSWFGVTPVSFWRSMADLAGEAWVTAITFFDWAGSYILVGAAVVVPLYMLRHLLKFLGKKPAASEPNEEG